MIFIVCMIAIGIILIVTVVKNYSNKKLLKIEKEEHEKQYKEHHLNEMKLLMTDIEKQFKNHPDKFDEIFNVRRIILALRGISSNGEFIHKHNYRAELKNIGLEYIGEEEKCNGVKPIPPKLRQFKTTIFGDVRTR